MYILNCFFVFLYFVSYFAILSRSASINNDRLKNDEEISNTLTPIFLSSNSILSNASIINNQNDSIVVITEINNNKTSTDINDNNNILEIPTKTTKIDDLEILKKLTTSLNNNSNLISNIEFKNDNKLLEFPLTSTIDAELSSLNDNLQKATDIITSTIGIIDRTTTNTIKFSEMEKNKNILPTNLLFDIKSTPVNADENLESSITDDISGGFKTTIEIKTTEPLLLYSSTKSNKVDSISSDIEIQNLNNENNDYTTLILSSNTPVINESKSILTTNINFDKQTDSEQSILSTNENYPTSTPIITIDSEINNITKILNPTTQIIELEEKEITQFTKIVSEDDNQNLNTPQNTKSIVTNNEILLNTTRINDINTTENILTTVKNEKILNDVEISSFDNNFKTTLSMDVMSTTDNIINVINENENNNILTTTLPYDTILTNPVESFITDDLKSTFKINITETSTNLVTKNKLNQTDSIINDRELDDLNYVLTTNYKTSSSTNSIRNITFVLTSSISSTKLTLDNKTFNEVKPSKLEDFIRYIYFLVTIIISFIILLIITIACLFKKHKQIEILRRPSNLDNSYYPNYKYKEKQYFLNNKTNYPQRRIPRDLSTLSETTTTKKKYYNTEDFIYENTNSLDRNSYPFHMQTFNNNNNNKLSVNNQQKMMNKNKRISFMDEKRESINFSLLVQQEHTKINDDNDNADNISSEKSVKIPLGYGGSFISRSANLQDRKISVHAKDDECLQIELPYKSSHKKRKSLSFTNFPESVLNQSSSDTVINIHRKMSGNF